MLNPGKAVPTLRRCAEWGGMHVHGGARAAPGHPEVLSVADDFIAALCERVRDHAARGAPLRIRGGGTKDFYGDGARDGESLDMARVRRHRRLRAAASW